MADQLPDIGIGTYENTDPAVCAGSEKVDSEGAPWNDLQ